jgi:hypothetical protein
MANGRCRMHGGNAARGLAAGNFRTGRRSKYLPQRLLPQYEQALRDPDLLALREDIALVDARLADVLQRVDTGESGQIWRDLRQAFDEFVDARRSGDLPSMRVALERIEQLITRGSSDAAAWRDVAELLEQRRRLVESERRRLVESQQMLTVERAMVLLAAVVDIIRRHVTDRTALAAISAELGGLVALQAGGAPAAD